MDERKKLQYCKGCRENFYNGNNDLGIRRCWHLKDAKVVWRKEVSIYQKPPWKQKAIKVLDCYRKPGYVYVEADREY